MKTKRIILLVMVFVFLMALASCDVINGAISGLIPNQHEHSWVDATCETPKTCSECGETEGESLGHAEETVAAKAATCTEAGLTEGVNCSVCGAAVVAQQEIPALGHDLVVGTSVDATCTESGLTAGEHCTRCDHKVEQEEIPAKGHTEQILEGKAATCTEPGLTEGKKCSVCGETIVAQEEISATGHTEQILEGKAPTCSVPGLTEGKKCSDCGETLVAQSGIPETGHSAGAEADCTNAQTCTVCGEQLAPAKGHTNGEPVTENRQEPSCSELGSYDSVVYCSVCNAEISRETFSIPTIEHNPGNAVVENETPASCNAKGSYDNVVYCTVCNAELSRETVEIPLSLHTYDDEYDAECNVCGNVRDVECQHLNKTAAGEAYEPTCKSTGLTAGVKCADCGEILEAQQEINALPHTEVADEAVGATCTTTGLTAGKHCEVCGTVIEAQQEIPALQHNYETVYEWAEDNSSCTEKQICANDASHVVEVEAVKVSQITLNVTASKVTYTYHAGNQTKTIESDLALENNIATINAPAIAGRVASHDYVKFGFHDAAATYEFTIYYSEIDVWDGTSVSESLSGSGTAEDPFLIQSAADFAYFAGQLNAAAVGSAQNLQGQYFKMTVSIDLAGNVLIAGNHSAYNEHQGFGGSFDGNNCTIRGINVSPTTGTSAALFGCITKAGSLKNLSVYGNASGNATVGGVVAYLLGTIDNVTSYVTVSGKSTVGGIVANQESSSGAITNCVNYGTVTASSYIVGGIVGSGGNSVINSVNWATITGTDCVGGISGSSKAKGEITGCANYGTINASGKSGGIVGQLIKPVSNCTNYGTVNGTWSLGGIAGYVKEGSASISGCTNHGDVLGSTTGNGGILGLSESAATSTVANCVNYGSVTGSWGVGGISGDIKKGSVSGCINNGTISGIGQVAGICGKSAVAISGCTNNGTINASLCENIENDQISGSNVEKVDCVSNGSVVVAAHNMTHTDAKAETCEADGNVAYDYCSVCNRNYDAEGKEIANVVIPAKGHAYDDGVTENGKVTFTCANCGDSYQVDAKLTVTVNHLYLDGSVAAEAEALQFSLDEIATINAKSIEGYVASHDYVKVHVQGDSSVTIYYSQVSVWDGTDVWDGTSNVATSLDALGGAGTESDPYIIDSASDLALIANIVNSLPGKGSSTLIKGKYFKMTKSIDLNNYPLYIGGYNGWADRRIFDGHLDGNNCSIRGINNDRSLFGCIEGSAKNLSLYGKVNGTAGSESAFVAYLRGTIHHITNYASVTGFKTVAGIVSNVENKNAQSTYLTNYGTITSTTNKGAWSAVGGVMGCFAYNNSNLVNWGDIICDGSQAGGIGGYGHGSRAGVVESSYNYGTIYCSATATGQILGGIGGHTYSNCYEYGEIVNSLPTEE